MWKKLFVAMIACTLFVGCGTGTDENNEQSPNDAPTNENMNENEINDGTPGGTDDNLNREQIDGDIMPNDDDIMPDENNDNNNNNN